MILKRVRLDLPWARILYSEHLTYYFVIYLFDNYLFVMTGTKVSSHASSNLSSKKPATRTRAHDANFLSSTYTGEELKKVHPAIYDCWAENEWSCKKEKKTVKYMPILRQYLAVVDPKWEYYSDSDMVTTHKRVK